MQNETMSSSTEQRYQNDDVSPKRREKVFVIKGVDCPQLIEKNDFKSILEKFKKENVDSETITKIVMTIPYDVSDFEYTDDYPFSCSFFKEGKETQSHLLFSCILKFTTSVDLTGPMELVIMSWPFDSMENCKMLYIYLAEKNVQNNSIGARLYSSAKFDDENLKYSSDYHIDMNGKDKYTHIISITFNCPEKVF